MSCINTLKKNGLKVTPQRRLIVDAIHEDDKMLTAEQIINHVQSRMPEVHKSTIYRTLELLEKTGCVYKSDIGDQVVYHHAEIANHYHLICNRCGKIIECDEELFTAMEKSLGKKYGFKVNFKHLVLNGICRECSAQENT